jgi:hypothetical protein
MFLLAGVSTLGVESLEVRGGLRCQLAMIVGQLRANCMIMDATWNAAHSVADNSLAVIAMPRD